MQIHDIQLGTARMCGSRELTRQSSEKSRKTPGVAAWARAMTMSTQSNAFRYAISSHAGANFHKTHHHSTIFTQSQRH